MKSGESLSFRPPVAALVAAALLLGSLALLPSPAEAIEGTSCGTVTGFEVTIVKGGIDCSVARHATKAFGKTKHCGLRQSEPACVAQGFHCRLASLELLDRLDIGGFCYTLVHPLPPSRDHSTFDLDAFTSAFAIAVAE